MMAQQGITPETYFRLLEPDELKRSALLATLKKILTQPIQRTGFVIIRGAPASGKSTLVRLLSMLRPTQRDGLYWLLGRPLCGHSYNLKFGSAHFAYVTNLVHKNSVDSDISWLRTFVVDNIPYRNDQTKKVEIIVPKVWFIFIEHELFENQSKFTKIEMNDLVKRDTIYIDLSMPEPDRAAKIAFDTAFRQIDLAAFDQYIANS